MLGSFNCKCSLIVVYMKSILNKFILCKILCGPSTSHHVEASALKWDISSSVIAVPLIELDASLTKGGNMLLLLEAFPMDVRSTFMALAEGSSYLSKQLLAASFFFPFSHVAARKMKEASLKI